MRFVIRISGAIGAGFVGPSVRKVKARYVRGWDMVAEGRPASEVMAKIAGRITNSAMEEGGYR